MANAHKSICTCRDEKVGMKITYPIFKKTKTSSSISSFKGKRFKKNIELTLLIINFKLLEQSNLCIVDIIFILLELKL